MRPQCEMCPADAGVGTARTGSATSVWNDFVAQEGGIGMNASNPDSREVKDDKSGAGSVPGSDGASSMPPARGIWPNIPDVATSKAVARRSASNVGLYVLMLTYFTFSFTRGGERVAGFVFVGILALVTLAILRLNAIGTGIGLFLFGLNIIGFSAWLVLDQSAQLSGLITSAPYAVGVLLFISLALLVTLANGFRAALAYQQLRVVEVR